MSIKRRDFLQLAAATTATGFVSSFGNYASAASACSTANAIYQNVNGKFTDVQPVTLEERKQRIAKAQQLMQEHDINALILDSGTSLLYFTGISWWPSERTMVAVIPAKGEVQYVCPAFEEGRLRELITLGNKVNIWQEDESPFKQIRLTINDSGINSGMIAIDETARFFIADGLRKEAPDFEYINGNAVTMPCRMVKSDAEIALMQRAADITVAAIKVGISKLKEGVSPDSISAAIAEAHAQMGAVNDFADVTFGRMTSSPHGSIIPENLKKGDVVLLDCGCKVEGYSSDITRSIIFGSNSSPKQLQIWQLEKKAQATGFAAAKLGVPCEAVDAAARKVITDAGLGPGYKLPGVPHRTGHGIGMDVHEYSYIVKGNKQPLVPGMCFSIEPTIIIPNEFGIRLEDCVYMKDEGPKWFSQPSPSIDQPFV